MGKFVSREILKNIIYTVILISVLTFSYLKTKKESEYNPFKLKELNNNKITLLYFGFLSCPDACPTTLSKISAVFKEMSPELLSKVSFLFIDLDPERDTFLKLQNYTAFFHPKIIPISLSLEELSLFSRYFGISFLKVPLKSAMGYTIDHSTQIVVVSPDRKILKEIEHDTPKKNILLELNKLIVQYKGKIK